jgi:hypothetical protein
MFFRYLATHPDYQETGLPQVYGRETFRANEFYRQLADWEIAWTKQHHATPVEWGDDIKTSLRLLEKYRPVFDRYYPVPDALATASAVQGDHAPAQASDGQVDLNSYWSADPAPQWWQLDLLKARPVGRVQVFPYWGDGRYYQYKVEVSPDAKHWTLVADLSQNTKPATADGELHKFSPIEARHVRVTMLKNSANTGVHLVEVKVLPPR